MEQLKQFIETVGPYLAILLGAATTAWSLISKGKRDRADITSQVTGLAEKWLDVANKRIDDLQAELDEARAETRVLRDELGEARLEARQQKRLAAAHGEQLNILATMVNQSETVVKELTKKYDSQLVGARQLAAQVRELGQVPVWSPPNNGKETEDVQQ